MLLKLRNITQDQDISEGIFLINKIKEYRHNKFKGKQINKFDRLLSKCNGYYHNFGTFGGHTSFGGHIHNTNYRNVQDNISSSSATFTTTAPMTLTTAIALTTTTTPTTTAAPTHTVLCTKNKWVINLSTTPPPQCRNTS